MKILKSAEDYLETIHILNERNGLVRSIDVAQHLCVSKPSVSVAVKHLREAGYLEMDAQSHLLLTPAGSQIARRVYARHKLLTSFLMRLGVDEEQAQEDACKIEHDISPATFEAIQCFMQE